MGGQHIDVVIKVQGVKQLLGAEVKKWAAHKPIGALIEQVRNLPIPGLLIADYVNPRMATKLRAAKIQFMDMAGNAFIDQFPVYIFVSGRKQARPLTKNTSPLQRAFEASGLKLIYSLLRDPELVAKNYREIAATVDVAVGTVGWVFKGLHSAGFLIIDEENSRDRKLQNLSALLDKWVEHYPMRLRPRQMLGKFASAEPAWYQNANIAALGAQWGGEVAAEHYLGGNLNPEDVIIYLPTENLQALIEEFGLAPISDGVEAPGRVQVYERFWPDDNSGDDVDPILVYADLLATASESGLKAAGEIFDQHIKSTIS